MSWIIFAMLVILIGFFVMVLRYFVASKTGGVDAQNICWRQYKELGCNVNNLTPQCMLLYECSKKIQ